MDCRASVAEAGVFQGDFARIINKSYPNRTLYLFDTFEGFSEKDIEYEKEMSNAKVGDYRATNEKLVIKKMIYPLLLSYKFQKLITYQCYTYSISYRKIIYIFMIFQIFINCLSNSHKRF